MERIRAFKKYLDATSDASKSIAWFKSETVSPFKPFRYATSYFTMLKAVGLSVIYGTVGRFGINEGEGMIVCGLSLVGYIVDNEGFEVKIVEGLKTGIQDELIGVTLLGIPFVGMYENCGGGDGGMLFAGFTSGGIVQEGSIVEFIRRLGRIVVGLYESFVGYLVHIGMDGFDVEDITGFKVPDTFLVGFIDDEIVGYTVPGDIIDGLTVAIFIIVGTLLDGKTSGPKVFMGMVGLLITGLIMDGLMLVGV
jgi:hypothetical protein